jgi:uncharacterized membrane protein
MQPGNKIQRLPELWGMVIILILAAGLRLPWLEAQSLVFDESWSLAVSSADWNTLFRAVLSSGVHPPLFYVIHKSTLALWGGSEFGQRFATAMFSILSVALIYRAGRLMLNKKTALFAALLLALNPLHIWFAQEARMYSLLGALTLVSMAAFRRAIETNRLRYWVALGMANSISFILHYFSFFIPATQFVFLILTFSHNYRRLRAWATVQAIASIPLLPWLIFTALREGQTFGIGFLVKPTLFDLLVTFWNLTTGSSSLFWPIVVIGLAVSLLALVMALRPFPPHQIRFKQSQFLIILWVLLPPLVTWLVSQRRSFYADRYLTFIIPGITLLLAFGAMRVTQPRWRNLLIAGLIIASSFSLIATYLDPAFWKDDWRSAAAYVRQREQPDDVILLYTTHIRFVFDYYFQGKAPVEPISLNLELYLIDPLVANRERAWVIYPYTRRPTHYPMQPPMADGFWHNDPDRNPYLVEWLEARADQIMDYQHFPGIEMWLVNLEMTPRGQLSP